MIRIPRILVVEDEAHIARLLQFVLTRNGYDVQIAATGSAAVQCLQPQPPDAVLLDLNLPDMSGAEVLAAIRALPDCRNTAVIILSAHTFEYESQAVLQDSQTVRIAKPVAPSRLLDCLSAFGLATPAKTEVA